MVKVLIIEDEIIQSDYIAILLEKYDAELIIENQLETIIDTVEWLKNNACPDLIFMDVHLADGLCFEVFNEIEITSPIIYTTAYDDYILKAFKSSGLDYLVKPITKRDLHNALDKFFKLYT